MFRRSLSAETIKALNDSPMWKNLIEDENLLPEIRDNHVTVYYRGGALLRSLRLHNGGLQAEIHPKFIPVSDTKYLRICEDTTTGFRFSTQVEALQLGLAKPDILKRYKSTMDRVLSTFPEGLLVHRIGVRKDNLILDQEIALEESGQRRDKFDLCYYDSILKKLVFVEVKRVDDGRLFHSKNRKGRPEILDQLQRYCERLADNNTRTELLDAYREVIRLKRKIGLQNRLGMIPDDGPADLLCKPLLVIGGCSWDDIHRIVNGQDEWAALHREIDEVSAGLILCGSSGCKLVIGNSSQSRSFLKP